MGPKVETGERWSLGEGAVAMARLRASSAYTALWVEVPSCCVILEKPSLDLNLLIWKMG